MAGWFASWRTMRAGRPDRISRTEADQLVSDHCHDPQQPGLGLVLAAVRAPAWAQELADGEEAVTGLVAARRIALSAPPLRSRDVVVPARRKAVVALAATLGLLVVGGVAAAETGSLPAAVQQRAHDLFPMFGIPAPDPDSSRDGGAPGDPAPTPAPSVAPSAAPPSTSAGGTAAPNSTQVRALCRAWNDTGQDPNGATMDGASWQALVAAAGGRGRVAALCAALLTTAPTDGPTAETSITHPGAGQGNPSHTPGGRKNSGS